MMIMKLELDHIATDCLKFADQIAYWFELPKIILLTLKQSIISIMGAHA